MKIKEIIDKSAEELNDELIKLKKEAFNLRFQKAGGQLENTARVRFVRRSIAQILTIINSNFVFICFLKILLIFLRSLAKFFQSL